MAVEVGQEAPDFTLMNQSGEPVTLSQFRGDANVVLMFYPLAFSGVCTTQFTNVSAHEGSYAGQRAQLIGISVDSHHAQAAFAKALGLDATLMLADFEPKGAVARSYGVYNDDRGHSRRGTFVIDTNGIVRHVDIPKPLEIPDEDAVMAALNVC
jgi:peroxiredoxin (alkyl hydroperoxide reductase subunit C)